MHMLNAGHFFKNDGRSDVFDHERYQSGEFQLGAQAAVRASLAAGHSVLELKQTLKADQEDVLSRGYGHGQIASYDRVLPGNQEVLGANLALALSIPAPDYAALTAYVRALFKTLKMERCEREFNTCQHELFNHNSLNLYKIIRNIPVQAWPELSTVGTYKEELLTLAVAMDDQAMVDKVATLYSSYTDIPSKIQYELGRLQFTPLSQVRNNLLGEKIITFEEIHLRLKHQIDALEDQMDGGELYRPLDASTLDNEPVLGAYTSRSLIIDVTDRKDHLLPRYEQYMSHCAAELANTFVLALKRRDNPLSEEHQAVVVRMLNDFERFGVSREVLFWKHYEQKSQAFLLDLEETPGRGRTQYLRELMGGEKLLIKHGRNGCTFILSELLRREPIEDILLAAKNDEQLSGAYAATGQQVFLERMSGAGRENRLQSDLGI
jgi:hypothetical protein